MKNKVGFYFGGPLIVGVVFCLLSGAAAYLTLFKYTSQDENEYRRLLYASNPAQAGEADSPSYTARQKRYGVQKDFSYTRGGGPLHVHLESREAELVLDRQNDCTQIIEEMLGLKVFMQEELYYVLPDGREVLLGDSGRVFPRHTSMDKEDAWISASEVMLKPMQIVSYLQAEAGTYSYKSNKCSAKNVVVERYFFHGHDPIYELAGGQLISTGIAESVEFTMGGEDPRLTAHHFTASILQPENI